MIDTNCKSGHKCDEALLTTHATPPVQGATRQRRCMSAGTSTVLAGAWCLWTVTSGSRTCPQVPPNQFLENCEPMRPTAI
jgi:hypothetical protein